MHKKSISCILDFDGTLTTRDTLHLVAQAGYRRQMKSSSGRRLPPWQEMVDGYLADYKARASQYTPKPAERRTLASEASWLDSLQDVERASADRVNDAGIFDQLTKQDMESAAHDAWKNDGLALRSGWAELLTVIHKINTVRLSDDSTSNLVQVVSVNWSRWFVWSVLWKAATCLEDRALAKSVSDVLRRVAVYANEVTSIISEVGSSSVQPSPAGQAMTLRTAGDKLRHMQSKLPKAGSQADVLTVYIGDSTTDLECLLLADVGVCIRDHNMSSSQQELESTCVRLGVQLKNLNEAQATQRSSSTLDELEQSRSKSAVVLYFAYDFHEVARWMTRTANTIA